MVCYSKLVCLLKDGDVFWYVFSDPPQVTALFFMWCGPAICFKKSITMGSEKNITILNQFGQVALHLCMVHRRGSL